MKNSNRHLRIVLFIVFSSIFSTTIIAGPSANLNQGRNGTESLPQNPIQWVNGNMGNGTAHYVEGMSAPYQCIMIGMTAGSDVVLTIGYDIKNSNKNAFDYLTHYNRIEPHLFYWHSTAETINPLTGTGLAANTSFMTYPIPQPSSAGSPLVGMPGASYNALVSTERVMTMYNGTIDSIYYSVQGNLTANSSETRIVVRFHPSASTVVLLWGGHIGSRADWGYTGMTPKSAGGISGSPFHMRLVGWNLGSIGNQDRSLSGSAVQPPPNSLPVNLLNFAVKPEEKSNLIQWSTATEINNDHFTVERAGANLDFQTLVEVRGAGNSTMVNQYSWEDSEPINGLSYYRLVQTDFDGTKTIYGPVAVSKKQSGFDLTLAGVFPNPFASDFALTYSSSTDSPATLQVMDATGKLVYSEQLNSTRGSNYVRCEGEKFATTSGIYFIMLTQGDRRSNALRIYKDGN